MNEDLVNNELNNKHDYLDTQFRSLKRLIDSLSPSLDQLRVRFQPIKNEAKETSFIINNLNNLINKIAKDFGHSIGQSIIGNKQTNNIMNVIPKLFNQFFGGARANGGPVNSNKAYLVGERGPEIFMPHNAGHVIANKNLTSGINLVMNINTNDSNSFRKNQTQILTEAISSLRRASRNL